MVTNISSIGATARDYTTPAAWEAAVQGDLVTAGNIEKGEMYKDADFTAGVTIDGSITDVNNYMWLTSPVGQRHTGKESTGVVIKATAGAVIHLADDYTVVEWLELDGGSTTIFSSINGITYTIPNCTVRNNIIHGFHTGNAWHVASGISCSNNSGGVYDNIIYDIQNTSTGTITGGAYGIVVTWTFADLLCNTVYGITNPNATVKMAYGFFMNTGASANAVIKNCLAMGCDTLDFGFAASFTGTANNNGSSDTSAPGTSAQISKTVSDQFVNLTDDFRLKSGADMIDTGVDLGVIPSGVEIDINGINRDTDGDDWDIGAHLFIASTVTVTKQTILKHNVIESIVKPTILKQNLIGLVSKTSILKQNILNSVQKQTILKQNLIEAIPKLTILKHNILNSVASQTILKHNIIEAISKNTIIKHNIQAAISKASILKQNIQTSVNHQTILKQNILNTIQVLKQSILKQNIRQSVVRQSIMKQNIIKAIPKQSILKHNIRSAINKQTILKHNIIQAITQSTILKQNLIEEILKNTILKHNIVNSIIKSSIIKHNIRTAITKSIILKQNVIESINKQTILKHNLIESVAKNIILKQIIKTTVIQSTILKQNILLSTNKQTILKHSLFGVVTKSTVFKHNIIQAITKSTILKQKILMFVSITSTSLKSGDTITTSLKSGDTITTSLKSGDTITTSLK